MTVETPAITATTRAHGTAVRFVLRRVVTSLLVLWGAVTVTFLALHLMPGDIAYVIAGTTQTSPEVHAQITHEYLLDRPLLAQYLAYVGRLVRGDLGTSYLLRTPVTSVLGEHLPATLSLLGSTMVIAVVASVVVAVLTAHRRSWIRSLCTSLESLAVATPAFWLGIVALTVFSFQLHLFPAVGGEGLSGLVLPAVTLAVAPTAMITQVLRRGLEEALDEPFVVTARTRGLGEIAIRVRHVLRPALLPVTSLVGWITGALIGGAVVVEQVFSRQGLGRLVVMSINGKDIPVVAGVVLVAAVGYVLINILVDLLYLVIDPRLRGAS
ncbi:ABC transporter permease [Kibdelosporangium lantanae]